MSLVNLRQFLQKLRAEGEIAVVEHPVSTDLELAEIHRRVAAADGPALFFKNVKNSKFPVVTNLFGSIKRMRLAFDDRPEEIVHDLVGLLKSEFPPKMSQLWQNRGHLMRALKMGTKRVAHAPILEVCQSPIDLEAIPFLKTWPEDGGHFLTLPLVYTEPPGGGPSNLGMYRIQRFDKTTTGLHFQIAKGGGYHYNQAEQLNASLPVNIFLGGAPALMMSAIAPLPENVPELMLAAFLQGEKLKVTKSPFNAYPLIGECEFAFVGKARPHVRRPEGPFGDHYGYYSLTHPFPVFECEAVYHRKDAIYPATVVGKPRQEDFYIGDFLQKLLSPLFPVVMPGVKNLWSYGETGFHSLSAAVVKERFDRESMTSAFRILGEGQLSLTKFLLMTDQDIDLNDFPLVLTTILERFRPEKDLFIFSNLSLDTLDYTGPELNKGSRGVLLGLGEKVRSLPTTFQGSLPPEIKAAIPFCPGCLVIEGKDFDERILQHPSFANWPLLILVDDAKKACKNVASFLWTTFTRFEPAADIHASKTNVFRHHLCYHLPLLIDARMKPSYPKEVLCDDQTYELVSKNWSRYFPKGMTMGESQTGHVV